MTKGRVIGKHVAAVAAPPAGQPDRHAEDRVVDHQPQATAAQLMGCERLLAFLAAGARVSVTRTNGALLPDSSVMFLNFGYSRGDGQFDTDGRFFHGRSEGHRQSDLAPPFFVHTWPARQKEGGVQE